MNAVLDTFGKWTQPVEQGRNLECLYRDLEECEAKAAQAKTSLERLPFMQERAEILAKIRMVRKAINDEALK